MRMSPSYPKFCKRKFVKGAMQRDFNDLILATIQNFCRQNFFFFLAVTNARILHKNDCELKLFYKW